MRRYFDTKVDQNEANTFCDIFNDFVVDIKKPELIAQILYFLLQPIFLVQATKIDFFIKEFKEYLRTTGSTNQCFKVFSNFLLQLKRSGYLDKVLQIVKNSESLQIEESNYAKQIETKINELESAIKGNSIKQYFNPITSFLFIHKKKLGVFGAAFFLFHFEYLQKVFNQIKNL